MAIAPEKMQSVQASVIEFTVNRSVRDARTGQITKQRVSVFVGVGLSIPASKSLWDPRDLWVTVTSRCETAAQAEQALQQHPSGQTGERISQSAMLAALTDWLGGEQERNHILFSAR